MKHLIKLMMIAMLMLTSAPAYASSSGKKTQRATREQLAERQAKTISQRLGLSDEASARFVSTYVSSQKEMWALNRNPANTSRHNKRAMTEEQTDSAIRARFDHSQKTLDIRRKYYKEYRKFLSAKQVERVYDMESHMIKRLKAHRTDTTHKPRQAKRPSRKRKTNNTTATK